MKTVTYTTEIDGDKVEIKKVYRTRTQFEYFLTIYMGDSDTESLYLYNSLHLTKKSALNEAIRAIAKKPRIERIF
jgi:hypothetical protein